MTEPAPSTDAAPDSAAATDPLAAGRAALARHDWAGAFALLNEADARLALGAGDLEALAEAAFFAARPDVENEVKERAHKAYLAAGDVDRAAYLALDIAKALMYEGRTSIGSAWIRRAERLLEGRDESYAHGFLALLRSEVARARGDIAQAVAQAEAAAGLGERFDHADLRAYALSALGALKIANGQTADGFALMEEATIAAVNGELSAFTTGVTCCTMIAACRDLTDYRRAAEWTEATERWCERQAVSGFPGVCRVHRAEVVALGGAWERAAIELIQATDELERYKATPPQADGFYALGDLRRQMGDLDRAEEALREAHARGRSPQPALALIRLAEGKIRAAASAINAAVRDEIWDQWARARLLPAQVEIAVAASDLETARLAVDEFERISSTYDSPALAAQRHQAWGRIHLAEGRAADAVRELRGAVRSWREVATPYEVGRARALLSRALRAVGDEEGADLELRAAHDEFIRLGAQLDALAAEQERRAVEDRRAGPIQVRRTFLFTDVVGSTQLAEALGDEAWERLLRWHDDTLLGLFARNGGEVVNSTGDGFFVTFDGPTAAVECAVAIQRALAEQRRASGFAISVRIGIHTAEANRRGDDYSGMGVHLAARVAAIAGAGEILVTADARADAPEVPAAETRDVVLRGVSLPVSVASVPWE